MATELITTTDQQVAAFELAQRRAQAFSGSALMVPAAFRGNLGDCLIAEEMAQRMGASTLQVMQNIHIIHGRPSFSAKFLIACWNASGKYGPIDYEISGSGDDYGCVATSTRNSDGKVITGPRVTMGMAASEGWSTKNGSKWRTMPDLMLRYRAATMMINVTDPGLSMGMLTSEEMHDITPEKTTATVLPDLPPDADIPASLPPAAEVAAEPAKEFKPRLKTNDAGQQYGEFAPGEWRDINGELHNPEIHGTASNGDASYKANGEFRARRGAQPHTANEAEELIQ